MARDEYDESSGRSTTRVREDQGVVLKPGQFVHTWDKSSGEVNVHVGPCPSISEVLVLLDKKGEFIEVKRDEGGIQNFIKAVTGQYIALENPAVQKKEFKAGKNQPVELKTGKTVNTPGPFYQPLWPGQVVSVIDGHKLAYDEYLIVRVYDEVEEGKEEVQAAVRESDDPGKDPDKEKKDIKEKVEKVEKVISLKGKPIGYMTVIKGKDVSFYIPPTGVEVVKDDKENYVRKAVVLSDMEFCAIRDEKGVIHYHRGPGVVFPNNAYAAFVINEKAVRGQDNRIFKAYTLLTNEKALHLRVIKGFDKERGDEVLPRGFKWKEGRKSFEAGEEILIRDLDCIFFPFDEIEVIAEISAVSILDGEGIYVQSLLTGKVEVVEGPKMRIIDPREEKQVIRDLSPGDEELLGGVGIYVYTDSSDNKSFPFERATLTGGLSERTRQDKDRIKDKAILVYAPSGMAVMRVGDDGEGNVVREVVLGPAKFFLGWNEWLEALVLSTGKPKDTDKMLKSYFLRVEGNRVSDIITAHSADGTAFEVKVSYRVSFRGDDSVKWFTDSNYVKLLCDHMRSRLKGAAKQKDIAYIFKNHVEMVRDTVLGKKEESGQRSFAVFNENSMTAYDVEVLSFEIQDKEIEKLLQKSEQDAVKQEIEIKTEAQNHAHETKRQEIQRQTDLEQHKTRIMDLDNKRAETTKKHEIGLLETEQTEVRELRIKGKEKAVGAVEAEMIRAKLEAQLGDKSIQEEKNNEFAIDKARSEAEAARIKHEEVQANEAAMAKIEADKLAAETEATVEVNASISQELIAAIQTHGQMAFAASIAENFSVPAMLEGKSVADIAGRALAGIPAIAGIIKDVLNSAIVKPGKSEK